MLFETKHRNVFIFIYLPHFPRTLTKFNFILKAEEQCIEKLCSGNEGFMYFEVLKEYHFKRWKL